MPGPAAQASPVAFRVPFASPQRLLEARSVLDSPRSRRSRGRRRRMRGCAPRRRPSAREERRHVACGIRYALKRGLGRKRGRVKQPWPYSPPRAAHPLPADRAPRETRCLESSVALRLTCCRLSPRESVVAGLGARPARRNRHPWSLPRPRHPAQPRISADRWLQAAPSLEPGQPERGIATIANERFVAKGGRRPRRSSGQHGMIDTTARKLETGADVRRLQVWQLVQNRLMR